MFTKLFTRKRSVAKITSKFRAMRDELVAFAAEKEKEIMGYDEQIAKLEDAACAAAEEKLEARRIATNIGAFVLPITPEEEASE